MSAESLSMGTEGSGDLIAGIISEFSEVLAFSRTRWARSAEQAHSELSGASIMMLQFIYRKGPVTATGLSQILDMDKSIVSRQVAKLRELDLIVETESPDDRRVTLLTASDEAKKIMDRIRELWASSYRERFAGWSEGELEALREGLHRFNAAVDARHDGPAVRCARHANAGSAE